MGCKVQGSVLGPLLFLNDVICVVSNRNYMLITYALINTYHSRKLKGSKSTPTISLQCRDQHLKRDIERLESVWAEVLPETMALCGHESIMGSPLHCNPTVHNKLHTQEAVAWVAM